MPHATRIRSLAISIGLGVTLALLAPGAAGAAPTTTVSGTFVGTVGDGGPSIAVVAGTAKSPQSARAVAVYVCDGKKFSEWYRVPAAVKGNVVELRSKSGLELKATLARTGVTGTVELPGQDAATAFKASPATGIAGLFLVKPSTGSVRGVSAATLAKLKATSTRRGDGSFAINGTVTPRGGKPRSIRGVGSVFGALSKEATWIVAPTGGVRGQAGGGNCSAWQSFKSLLFGVDCRFFQLK
jgi:hypothetical protein